MSRLPRSAILAWTVTSFALGALCCRTLPNTTAAPSDRGEIGSPQGGARIAVVDMQRAAAECSDGVRAQAEFKRLFEQRQKDLDRRHEDLARSKVEIEELAKKGASRDELERRLSEWYRRVIDYQLAYKEHQDDLQRKQSELTGPILQKLIRAADRLAAERGFDVVVDKGAVPHVRVGLDITEGVMLLAAAEGDGR